MWRRFGNFRERVIRRKKRLSSLAIFQIVEQQLRDEIPLAKHRWRQHSDFSYLANYIEAATERAKQGEAIGDKDTQAAAWLLALVLRSPRAAQAQVQMDKHKHSYRNRDARVMELIDFNDAYVAAVLAMPSDHLHEFNDELKRLIDWFTKRVGAWTFSTEQFEAITHGLSREIAVFNAVRAKGFKAEMTNRVEDAFGIDIHIYDPLSARRVDVDTKTTSAFHYRLIELFREGRLSQADIDLAEKRGFTAVINGHGDEKRRVILWRIDHGTLGNITDFRFEYTEKLIEELRQMISDYGEES